MDCIGNRNVRLVLEHKASQFADNQFIIFEDQTGYIISYTYKEFDEMVNRYANLLLSRGIKKGDKVTVHMMNSPEFLFSFFALAKIGAVVIPTNILSSAFEMEYFLEFSEAVAVITEPSYMDMFDNIVHKVKRVQQIFLTRTSAGYPHGKLYPNATIVAEMLQEMPIKLLSLNIHIEDDLMMLFTAGATAQPKVVQLTHANAVFAGIFGAHTWKVVTEDRHFITLPLFHVNGQLISLMPTLTAGATLIIAEQFSAEKYLEQAMRHRATTASLVGAMVRMILQQPPSERDTQHHLRLIMYAIAVSDEEWDAFESRFRVKLCDLWGMTETLGATTINPIDGVMKKNCIGLPRLGNDVKVVDERGNEVPAGSVGELVVEGVPGRTVMKGYYKNPDATRNTIRNGWVHTGDYAFMDEEGYFHFIGKKRDALA